MDETKKTLYQFHSELYAFFVTDIWGHFSDQFPAKQCHANTDLKNTEIFSQENVSLLIK